MAIKSPSNDVIVERIDGLKELLHEKFDIIDTRFRSVNGRLDKLNGKVTTHEKYINKQKGAFKFITIGTGIMTSLIILYYKIIDGGK